MKKYITAITASILIFTSLFSVMCYAACGTSNWYCTRKNGKTVFPPNSNFVEEHGGLFFDGSEKAQREKIIYLTFDAGYENGNINKILDTLQDKGVKGSFFILSNLIIKHTDLVKRMFRDGHGVCNHTSKHNDLTKMTDIEIKENLNRIENICYDLTGKSMKKFFRFPEGHYDERTILFLEENGYTPVFWSFAYCDWNNESQPDKDRAIELVLNKTRPGDVVLLHPTSNTNAEILPILIDKWREMGYSFGTLEEFKNRK